jgi:hypothetical protein
MRFVLILAAVAFLACGPEDLNPPEPLPPVHFHDEARKFRPCGGSKSLFPHNDGGTRDGGTP